jgi:hypothetical protein
MLQEDTEMSRAAVITVVLGSLGAALASSAVLAQDWGRHGHDEHRYEQRHERWEGRGYDRHEWEHRNWDRHYSDRVGRRRIWNGRDWEYMLPPPPHASWHWDVNLGRYCQ